MPTSFGPNDYALITIYALAFIISPVTAAALLGALQFWEVIHRNRPTR
nr:hypothetical protein OH837_48860 [Streptomyces canus]